MSETAMASLAVQRAFYTALNGQLTDPVTSAAVPVVDQPVENQAFPFVRLCDVIETARNTFQHTGRRCLATIDVWIRSGADSTQDGWYQARAIAGQIDVLLDGAAPAASDGWTFVLCQLQSAKDMPEKDAITRRVILEYEVLVELTVP